MSIRNTKLKRYPYNEGIIHTKEEKALLKKWNKQLTESGLDDIEMGFPDTPSLKRPDSKISWYLGSPSLAKDICDMSGNKKEDPSRYAATAAGHCIESQAKTAFYDLAGIFLNNKDWSSKDMSYSLVLCVPKPIQKNTIRNMGTLL